VRSVSPPSRAISPAEPAVEAQAGGTRNLDEPADAVDGDPWRDLDFLRLAGVRRPMRHLKPGERAAAGQERQGAGEAPAVVGLLVDEVLRVEQHAGGIGGAFGPRPGIERIGFRPTRDGAHDHSFLRGRRGLLAGGLFGLRRGGTGSEPAGSPPECGASGGLVVTPTVGPRAGSSGGRTGPARGSVRMTGGGGTISRWISTIASTGRLRRPASSITTS
jgi:hypothetical protein